MKFLITGGEGFIGRNIREALVNDNHEVATLDMEGTPDYKGSILDLNLLSEATRNVDGVFHLAATTSPPQFETDLYSGFNTNVLGTLNVLKKSAENGVRRVVLASSSAIYGAISVPGKEDMAIPGHENMYATTKLFDEYLGKYFSIRKELEVVSLRFFNAYGIGENSKGMYSSVISKFLESISKGENPVIFGDGSQSRDFIYVKDIAAGSKAAMFTSTTGESYNVGTGNSYSFNRIVEIMSDVFGTVIKPTYVQNPFKNYQMFTQADMSKTLSQLNWKPSYDLKNGIIEVARDLNLL